MLETDGWTEMAMTHAEVLDILARAEPGSIKAIAERLLEQLGDIEVLSSRTGLAMLPFVDTVLNTAFHLGEVLVAEAHIRLTDHGGLEGYGAVVGRDLEQAMAMAIVDGALAASVCRAEIERFIAGQAAAQAKQDDDYLRKVEATRVKMETF